MGVGQLLEVLPAEASAAPTGRMGPQGELGRRQPAAKRFGINGKEATTVGQRQKGHRLTPLLVRRDKNESRLCTLQAMLPTELQGIFPAGFYAQKTSRQSLGLRQLSLAGGDGNSRPNTDGTAERSTTDRSAGPTWGRAR